jgi:hypothetical protein
MVVCFSLVGLFGLNALTTGELSYQGGERKTFYGATTGFPFANTWETFDNRGVSVSTDAVPFDILLQRDTAPVLAWNLLYLSSAGFVPFLHDPSNPDNRYLGVLVRVLPIYFN